MRLKSDIFVAALTRRVFGLGGFAAVERHGAAEAGAIFVRQRFRDGLESLYAPAPQYAFGEDDAGGRLFERRLARVEPADVAALLARESRFDSDLWVVEVEIDDIGDLLPVADEGKGS
ncbi:DUF1491 domain-containing protein [Metarhizobium album]|uniref:DUF1491 domain-containing protein n=1 Tax=Metarhizobium album TaxID=2182425 RepID=A0A2U2DXW4_9HYPH|nr:DUF1491 family protein [Rhizobium album]PWE58158.1 DUF1491 domain-containing protein [Rhizobium album]